MKDMYEEKIYNDIISGKWDHRVSASKLTKVIRDLEIRINRLENSKKVGG